MDVDALLDVIRQMEVRVVEVTGRVAACAAGCVPSAHNAAA